MPCSPGRPPLLAALPPGNVDGRQNWGECGCLSQAGSFHLRKCCPVNEINLMRGLGPATVSGTCYRLCKRSAVRPPGAHETTGRAPSAVAGGPLRNLPSSEQLAVIDAQLFADVQGCRRSNKQTKHAPHVLLLCWARLGSCLARQPRCCSPLTLITMHPCNCHTICCRDTSVREASRAQRTAHALAAGGTPTRAPRAWLAACAAQLVSRGAA